MSLFVFLLVLLVLGGGYGLVLKHWGLNGLTCGRSFSHDAAYEGDEDELVEVVSNDRPLLVPWLRVESRIPAGLRFGRQENLDVSGEMYHRSLFTLMPYQRIRRRHKVRFLKRGTYNIGNATLTVGNVLGQVQCAREQQMSVQVTVYPRLLKDNELPEAVAELMGELIVERQLQRDPFLTRGIRPYLFGDPVRDIHWPATARTGEAQVRVHDFTTQSRLMVIMNSQTREDQWDNLMDYEQGVIEQEIRIAATMCVKLLRSGLTAGFACNMPLTEHGPSAVLLPSGGMEQEEELLSAFAHLRVLRTRRFNAFLEELDLTGMDMIVLSPYDSDALQAQLALLRHRGNRVQLCITCDEEATDHAD